MRVALALLLPCLGAIAAVHAACPVDDFDDGDAAGWIHCGDWSERQQPMWDASSGRYCLGLAHPLREPPPPPIAIAAEWPSAGADPRYANGCVRVGFRSGSEAAGTWSTHFVIGLRADCRQGGYKAMIGPSLGRASIFRTLELLADNVAMTFTEDTEYRAEFCAIDDHLSLKVWPRDGAEPASAQLHARNAQYTRGNIGIGVFIENDNRGPNVIGCFDDISFVPARGCRGDLDCSGAVDSADLRLLGTTWGRYTPCAPTHEADLNADCRIGFADALGLARAWGACPAEAAP